MLSGVVAEETMSTQKGAPANAARAVAKRTATRQRLWEAAVRLFSDQGYAATSVRDLGAAVGIRPGSVYAHIESKHALLVELVERGIDEYLEATAHLNGSARQQLADLVAAHVSVVAQDIDRALVVYHQWRHIESPDRERVLAKRREYETRISAIIDTGVDAGDFTAGIDRQAAVRTILGVLNWCPEWLSPEGPEPVWAVSAGLARIVLASVGADRSTAEA